MWLHMADQKKIELVRGRGPVGQDNIFSCLSREPTSSEQVQFLTLLNRDWVRFCRSQQDSWLSMGDSVKLIEDDYIRRIHDSGKPSGKLHKGRYVNKLLCSRIGLYEYIIIVIYLLKYILYI